MTLLSIVRDAMAEVGLSQPTIAISSNDPGVVSMIAMVNRTGKSLMRKHNWEALQTEKTFTTVAQALQTSAVPSDFDRIINRTIFNRTQQRRLEGPLSSMEWQRRQAMTTAGIYGYFRIRGGDILIDPVPAAGETCAYEYITENWVTGDKSSMTLDADTSLIDEELVKLGAIWRFKAAKGFEYAEDLRDFEIETAQVWSRDGGRDIADMSGMKADPEQAYVPDRDWSIT